MLARRKFLLKLLICMLYIIGVLIIVRQIFYTNDSSKNYKKHLPYPKDDNNSRKEKVVDSALQRLRHQFENER